MLFSDVDVMTDNDRQTQICSSVWRHILTEHFKHRSCWVIPYVHHLPEAAPQLLWLHLSQHGPPAVKSMQHVLQGEIIPTRLLKE